MWLLNKTNSKTSSRKQIQIKEVKDGILILPHNEYRLIIETSSINFELKSEVEQDVLIDNFQNFLNSLPSHIQILIRVREVDVNQYIEQISKTKETEKEKVYKDQITNYCEFIKDLVSDNKILSRRFYIIIPFTSSEKDFSIIRELMNSNREIIIRGLEKIGMKARELDSLEVLDLFYSFYNKVQSKTQELKRQTIKMVLGEHYA